MMSRQVRHVGRAMALVIASFDGTLFIPPFGTEERRVAGTLGEFRLLLANGVGLHGTDAPDSIGKGVTHGCIRLRDEAIAWLYANIPIGTRVVIH